jgi:hypothetical protein
MMFSIADESPRKIRVRGVNCRFRTLVAKTCGYGMTAGRNPVRYRGSGVPAGEKSTFHGTEAVATLLNSGLRRNDVRGNLIGSNVGYFIL